MAREIPYKEFRDKVKEGLKYYYDYLTDKEIDDYLNEEEDIIKEQYNHNYKDYLNGKITERVFLEGVVSGAVHSLYLLY